MSDELTPALRAAKKALEEGIAQQIGRDELDVLHPKYHLAEAEERLAASKRPRKELHDLLLICSDLVGYIAFEPDSRCAELLAAQPGAERDTAVYLEDCSAIDSVSISRGGLTLQTQWYPRRAATEDELVAERKRQEQLQKHKTPSTSAPKQEAP